MARGYERRIGADTRDFERAVKDGVIKPVDEAARSLDDLADAGEDAGRDGSRALGKLEDALRDVERQTDDAARSVKDMGDDGRRGFGRLRDGADEASEGVSDFKDEAKQNAQEVASSFDGSAESIADGFQGLAATAFAGFGPAGVVAGLAAAAGIGLAAQGFEASAEAQEASEEAIAGWADKFIEAGGRAMSAAQLVGEVTAIATDPERYKEAAENAKNWGVDEATAMRAIAGDATALEVVKKTLNDRTAEYTRILEENATGSGASYDKMQALTEAEQQLIREVSAGIPAWKKLTGEMAGGEKRAETVSQAFLGMIDDAKGAWVQVDKLGNKVVTLPDDTQIFIDAKTGQASQNIDRFKGDLDEIPKTKAVRVDGTVSLDKSGLTRQIKDYKAPPIKVRADVVYQGAGPYNSRRQRV